MINYPYQYYQFFIAFNEGDYYTCHDLLEDIWLTDKANLFLKGLLQMSVAIYHYEYGNLKGARAMLKTSRGYLKPYLPQHWGLDLETILAFIEQCLIIIPQDVDQVCYEIVKELPKLPVIYLYLEQ